MIDKIFLVGCGAVSEILYVPLLGTLIAEGQCRSIVVIDRSDARIEKIRRKLPQVSSYHSLTEAGDSISESLVIVALPHNLHAPVTIEALTAGAHVLCEKPMACSVDDCDAMIRSAESAGRQLAVGHFRRFFPVANTIREWIKNEFLGKLKSFRILEGEIYSWPAASESFFSRDIAGGGVLIDAGAHTIDLILWWLGEPESVNYWDDSAGGVEANCVLKFRMQTGATGYLQMSREWPLTNKYCFQFERGWIVYTCDNPNTFEWGLHGDRFLQKVELQKANGSGFDSLPKVGLTSAGFGQCFEAQLRNGLNAISGTERLVCSGKDARNTIALIERCYQNKRPLPQTWLPEQEQAAITRLF